MDYEAPFFIVGVPRSGTTLLAVLLNNHSHIYVGKTTPAHGLLELHRHIMEGYDRDGDVRRRSRTERLRQAVEAEHLVWEMCRNVMDRVEEGLAGLLAHACRENACRQGKRIWGDKSPFMLNHMAQLTLLMPGVRFVHLIRDGRAVAQSRHQRRGYPLKLAIHEWKQMILRGRLDGQLVGPERYLEVKFEELLTRPAETVAGVCRFLGVPFEEEMLALDKAEATAQPGAYVKASIDPSKINSWQGRLTAGQVRALEAVAGDLLQALGYSLQQHGSEGPFGALSPLAAICYRQQLALQDLMRPRRTTMINQQLVEIRTPFPRRLRRFLGESAAQYLSEGLIAQFRR